MSNQLVLNYINKNIKPEEQRFLTYFAKRDEQFKILLRKLRAGSLSDKECCKAAGIPRSAFYGVTKYGEMLFNYIDENDINEIINTIYCIGYNNTYYIQNFLETSSNIGNIKKSRSLDKSLIDNSKLVVEYRN